MTMKWTLHLINGTIILQMKQLTYRRGVIPLQKNRVDFLLKKYTEEIKRIYGAQLDAVILYGSYARGDFTEDSDIDIMILVKLEELEIKKFRHQLSETTFDFNMDFDLDIKPIAKSTSLFHKWLGAYPFYDNVEKEGVKLYVA